MFAGCGGQTAGQGSEKPAVLTTAAAIDQHDIDAFTSAVKFNHCRFVVTPGVATFTPSNELAQLLFGDPHGDAHKQSFVVPPIGGSASITITALQAEMAGTGLTLADSTATAKLSFDGLLHARIPAPIVGSVSSDIQVSSSSISVAFTYDAASARFQVAGVSSHLSAQAKNCGLLGWCNGIVNSVLRTGLSPAVEGLLRHAVMGALNSADATARLDELLAAGYNLKDPQQTPWTLVADTLNLGGGAFTFTAQRPGS
jgi:hypothetical protein